MKLIKVEGKKDILKISNGFFFENTKEVREGLMLDGYFKRWDSVNENGESYAKDSYDKFINHYFVKNKLNVPINLMHGSGFGDLAGKIVNMKKDPYGIFIQTLISRHAVHFENIKGLIDDGILQGFSDEGFATDFELIKNEKKEITHVNVLEAMLTKVSLVDMPAEGSAQFQIANATKFIGFEDLNKKEEKSKDGERKNSLLHLLKS